MGSRRVQQLQVFKVRQAQLGGWKLDVTHLHFLHVPGAARHLHTVTNQLLGDGRPDSHRGSGHQGHSAPPALHDSRDETRQVYRSGTVRRRGVRSRFRQGWQTPPSGRKCAWHNELRKAALPLSKRLNNNNNNKNKLIRIYFGDCFWYKCAEVARIGTFWPKSKHCIAEVTHKVSFCRFCSSKVCFLFLLKW